MHNYNHSLDFPFSKKTIKFREFTTAEQLSLAKSRLSLEDNLDYFQFVYDVCKGCIENKSDFECVDILEFFMFVIKLRILSVGPNIELRTTYEEKKTTVTVNLNTILKNLYNCFDDDNFLIEIKSMYILLGFPNVKNLSYLKISNKSNMETIQFFIKNFNGIEFDSLSISERFKLYKKIPASVHKIIENAVKTVLKKSDSIAIFQNEVFQNFRFNVLSESIYDFLRFLGSYDITSIHQEIYILSKLTPSYILTLSPNERKIYLNIAHAEKNQKQESSDDLKALELEFEQ